MNETIDLDPEPPERLKVGITYNMKKNSPSSLPDAEAEFDDAETIRAIQGALENAGFRVGLYEATEDLPLRLMQKKPDIVFNIAEGMNGRGREAHVPAILNYLRIPFTGSDETTMGIAMDKALTKRLVASYGVSTPAYQVVDCALPFTDICLSFPVIVKPNTEGSGKGISRLSIVSDPGELQRLLKEKTAAYQQDMLVEEFIHGREFTVGILGNGDTLRIFPPMEIEFDDISRGIYDYETKKNFRQHVRYGCPADIGAGLRKEMEDTAETIYRALACRDFARIDFRLSAEGRLYFLEINPLPGLAPGYSDFPILAAFCGMEYITLIQKILDCAIKRYRL